MESGTKLHLNILWIDPYTRRSKLTITEIYSLGLLDQRQKYVAEGM